MSDTQTPTSEQLTGATVYAVKDERTDGKATVETFHVSQPAAFAEPPEWAPFLPVPGVYHHPIYGELNYGSDTYERIIANFDAGIYQDRLPVNAEHDPQSSGAVGWIVGMRLADTGAIEVQVEWNERGRALIEGDRYRYVSAELFPWWTDPVDPERNYQDVAIGMAITTSPYFKPSVLPPLVASEAAMVRIAGNGKERVTMAEETQGTVQTPDTPADDVKQATDEILAQLSGKIDNKKISDPVMTDFVERAARELAEARAESKRDREEAKRLAEANAVLMTQGRLKRFSDEALGRSEANGTPWIGDVADSVRMACSLAERFGEDSWELKHYIERNRSHAEQQKAGALFKEIGSARSADGGLTAYDQLSALAAERQKQSNGAETFAQAFDEVLQSNHELRAAYGRELG